MIYRGALWISFLVGFLLPSCSTHSGGAPGSQCLYLTPKHGFQPQITPSPFKLIVDTTEIEPGNKKLADLNFVRLVFKVV